MSLHFLVIASSTPTPIAQVHDIEDMESLDDPLRGQSSYDSDSEEKKVTLVSGSIESVDFETLDQPRELKIGTSLSPDERDRLIVFLRSYLDVFAWSYEDMPGLNPSIVQHHLSDAPKPGGPLTTRQPAEYKWTSGYPTSLQKIGQSLLCTGISTQLQNLHIACPKQSNICNIYQIYPICIPTMIQLYTQ